MGKHKKLFEWCPRPENPITTVLRHYSMPIAVLISATIIFVSFSLLSPSAPTQLTAPPKPSEFETATFQIRMGMAVEEDVILQPFSEDGETYVDVVGFVIGWEGQPSIMGKMQHGDWIAFHKDLEPYGTYTMQGVPFYNDGDPVGGLSIGHYWDRGSDYWYFSFGWGITDEVPGTFYVLRVETDLGPEPEGELNGDLWTINFNEARFTVQRVINWEGTDIANGALTVTVTIQKLS